MNQHQKTIAADVASRAPPRADGVKILDSHMGAGSACAQSLAFLGADVFRSKGRNLAIPRGLPRRDSPTPIALFPGAEFETAKHHDRFAEQ